MDEYQLIDTLNSTLDIFYTIFSLYLTVVTAYLIAAFAYGKKLTRTQCIIVSAIYCFSSLMLIATTFSAVRRGSYIVARLNEVAPDYPISIPYASTIAYILLALMLLGLLASVKFMIDIRRA